MDLESKTPLSEKTPPFKEHLPELEPILEKLPEEEHGELIKQVILSATRYRGPLPPPEYIKGYEEALAGAADRIFSNMEDESKHRRKIEEKSISGELSRLQRGQWMAFALALICLGLGAYLAPINAYISGIFLTTTILGLVSVFVLNKRAETKEIEEEG